MYRATSTINVIVTMILVQSSSGNVKFEGFTTDKGKTEAQLNFKDADMEIKNKIDNKAVYTVEATAFKVMDGPNPLSPFSSRFWHIPQPPFNPTPHIHNTPRIEMALNPDVPCHNSSPHLSCANSQY